MKKNVNIKKRSTFITCYIFCIYFKSKTKWKNIKLNLFNGTCYVIWL